MKKYTPEEVSKLLAKARAELAAKQLEEREKAANELNSIPAATAATAVEQTPATAIRTAVSTLHEASKLESDSISADGTQSEEDKPASGAVISAEVKKVLGVARDDIVYNAKQQEFIDRACAGEDVVLMGAAGTGKTTCQRGLGKRLLASGKIGKLTASTKYLAAGRPGIVIVSFTNKAVNNIRHAMPEELKPNCITIHKLLEFAPVFYEVEDEEHPGEYKKTMRFEPTRNRYNPLPASLGLIIIEESSMVEVPLFIEQLMDALPHKPQIIFLGDIQQLPPVFGSSILGFKMIELPTIELTEVYRQALNSPIIALAWKILAGNPKVFDSRAVTVEKEINGKKVKRIEIPSLKALTQETPDGTVVFQPWQKKLSADLGLITCVKQFCEWADKGYYNSDEDILLCPFNVSFGTIELNKGISQHLGRKRRAVVHEVVAGYQTHYLAEGDRVLYAKEDAVITRIVRNGQYLGKSFQSESEYLDRWGHLRTDDMDENELAGQQEKDQKQEDGFDLEAIEKYMEAAAKEAEDRVTASSHIITLKVKATDEEVELETAGDVNQLLGGYAITVHKAQGSEWEKVFLVLQHTHATMNQRELLYTAVTRAKKHLHIICEPETFEKGIVSQKVKGNTLAEKAEFFKGKVTERERMLAEKAKLKKNDDPILLAFSKVTEWDALARDSIQHWWKMAQAFYPQVREQKVPDMLWKVCGSAAGKANLVGKVVTLNPVYLFLDPSDMIADTIPHEVAHLVAWQVQKDRGHGGTWKRVMEKFGKNPVESHYHDMGRLPAALRQVLEESSKANPNTTEEEV